MHSLPSGEHLHKGEKAEVKVGELDFVYFFLSFKDLCSTSNTPCTPQPSLDPPYSPTLAAPPYFPPCPHPTPILPVPPFLPHFPLCSLDNPTFIFSMYM